MKLNQQIDFYSFFSIFASFVTKKQSIFFIKKNTLTLLYLILMGSFNTSFAQKKVLNVIGGQTLPLERSAQSANFVVFWGENLSNPNTQFILNTCEDVYNTYINEYKVSPEVFPLTENKINIILNQSGSELLFSFSGNYTSVINFYDEKGTLLGMPYITLSPSLYYSKRTIAHEMAHVFQIVIPQLSTVRLLTGYSNLSFTESHAEFLSFNKYPNDIDDRSPLPARYYHKYWGYWEPSFYPSLPYKYWTWFEYAKQTEGMAGLHQFMRESGVSFNPYPNLISSHFLDDFRKYKGMTFAQLNDYMFKSIQKKVNSDYEGNIGKYFRGYSKKVGWNYPAVLDAVDESKGIYKIPDHLAPQSFGYNIIRLYPKEGCNTVQVKLKGHTTTKNNSDWRMGFVGVDGDNSRYSTVFGEGEAQFEAKSNEQIYLVVMGAPKKIPEYTYASGIGRAVQDSLLKTISQDYTYRFPYEISILGAKPEGFQQNYQPDIILDRIGLGYPALPSGKPHSNGGGFVDDLAKVSPSVYVSPNAIVLGSSVLTENVRIEDRSIVNNSVLKGNAIVKDRGVVDEYSYMEDNTIVSGNAQLKGSSSMFDNAKLIGNALTYKVVLSGQAVLQDNSSSTNSNLSGNVWYRNDFKADDAICNTGTYHTLPDPNYENTTFICGGQHAINNINTPYTPYTTAEMSLSSPLACDGNTANLPDLYTQNIQLSSTTGMRGAVITYTFDLKNAGKTAVLGNYRIDAYLSKDQTISSDDVVAGVVNTGNTPVGTISGVKGSITIPNNITDGMYYLLLKSDAYNVIAESNENNNVKSSSNTLTIGSTTPPSGNQIDIELSLSSNATALKQWSDVTFTLLVKNNSGVKAEKVVVSAPFVNADFAYSGSNVGSVVSKGTYNFWSDNVWNVGTLAANETATLKIVLFCKNTNPTKRYAEVTSASPQDKDSTPNNHVTTEDDQVEIKIGTNTPPTPPATNNIDVKLVSDKISYAAYQNVLFTITVKNNGTTSIQNAQIQFKYPTRFVTTSINLSSGSYGAPFQGCTTCEIWYLPLLRSGETATLKLNLYALSADATTVTAEMTSPQSIKSTITLQKVATRGESNAFSENISLYPNPTIGSNISLSYRADDDENLLLQWYDLQGKILGSQRQSFLKGDNLIDLDIQNFTDGLYFLTLLNENNGVKATLKVVKAGF